MTSETARSVCLPLCMKVFSHCQREQRRQSSGDTDFRRRWEGEMKRQEGGSECTIGMQRKKKSAFFQHFFSLLVHRQCVRDPVWSASTRSLQRPTRCLHARLQKRGDEILSGGTSQHKSACTGRPQINIIKITCVSACTVRGPKADETQPCTRHGSANHELQ